MNGTKRASGYSPYEADTMTLPIAAESQTPSRPKPAFRLPGLTLFATAFSRRTATAAPPIGDSQTPATSITPCRAPVAPVAPPRPAATAMPAAVTPPVRPSQPAAPAPLPARPQRTPPPVSPLLCDAVLLQLLQSPEAQGDPALRQLLKPSPVRSQPRKSYVGPEESDANPGDWKVWREAGKTPGTTVLHIRGKCEMPPDSASYRVSLQEAVVQTLGGREWVSAGADAGTSPILLLECIVAPAPFESLIPGRTSRESDGGDGTGIRRVPVSFSKIETLIKDPEATATTVGINPWEQGRQRHTHVTILPEGITLPIQEI